MTAPAMLAGLAYIRFAVNDPVASARFGEEIVGLQSVRPRNGEAALRSDDRAYALTFSRDVETCIAVEAWDPAALETLEARLKEAGFPVRRADAGECEGRRVQGAILARDGSGNLIEIVLRPERSARRFFGARDAGVTGLFGVGMRSKEPSQDFRFWRALGAEATDYVGEIAYLALDEMHHRIVLYPSKSQGPLYVAFEVASLDDLMRGHYFLAERQIKIVQGPGRQPASGQSFLHFQGPEGLIYSYVTGTLRRDPRSQPPRQFARDADSLCAWGSVAAEAPELSA